MVVRRLFLGCAFDEQNIWIYDIGLKGIEKVELETGKVIYYKQLSNELVTCNDAFTACAKIENMLIFAPGFESCVLAFDLNTEIAKRIELSFSDKININYMDEVICGKKVVFIPHFAQRLAVLDLETNEMEYNSEIIGLIPGDELACAYIGKKDNDEIYLIASTETENRIVVFNAKTNTFYKYCLGDRVNGRATCGLQDEDYLYIVFNEPSYISKYNKNSLKFIERIDLPKEVVKNNYSGIFNCGSYYLLTLWGNNDALLYDKQSREFEVISMGDSDVKKKRPEGYYQNDDGNIVVSFLSTDDGYGIWRSEERRFDEKRIFHGLDTLENVIKTGEIVSERSEDFSLEALITVINK